MKRYLHLPEVKKATCLLNESERRPEMD